MTPRELYLFDLPGFVVVRGALSAAEVARLTEAGEASRDLYEGGQSRAGSTGVQWVLADQGGDLGGFACIPGSHKSNFPRPAGISFYEEDRQVGACPEVKAGDLIIFTEQVTHGTLPWRGD